MLTRCVQLDVMHVKEAVDRWSISELVLKANHYDDPTESGLANAEQQGE